MQKNKFYCADCLEWLKACPDNTFDCIVTSPPYWGQRFFSNDAVKIWDADSNCEHDFEVIETRWPNASGGKSTNGKSKMSDFSGATFVNYHNRVIETERCSKCRAWKGQLGLEPELDLFIDHILQITAELRRVLKDSGTFWLNLGDSYSDSRRGCKSLASVKSLELQNYRIAIAMIDQQDWILRNVPIWHKVNPRPVGFQDRLNVSYEPFFFFVKSGSYYFDLEAIKVPCLSQSGMKNPGDVFSIPISSRKGSHQATFPEELIEKIIIVGCPKRGLVLDPFMGSGTTAIVSKRLGRDWIGLEICKEYVEIAKGRYGYSIDSYINSVEKSAPQLNLF